jgi:hypothetical protein
LAAETRQRIEELVAGRFEPASATSLSPSVSNCQMDAEETMTSTRRIRPWFFISVGILLAAALPVFVFAITTVEVKVVCPICHTENEFLDYASWGSYVYQYPSKFQLVFWPQTWSATVYSCKKCHLSLYMWDFKNFPKDKIEATKKVLEGTKLSGEYAKYTDIPASEKLKIAEQVYKGMNRDDDFWCQFYRVLGYHLDHEGKLAEATEARLHAVEIAKRMLRDPANEGRKKELLFISASMNHFTGDDNSALQQLKAAGHLKFHDVKVDEEHAKNYDEYLAKLIQDFIPAIEQGKVPKDF